MNPIVLFKIISISCLAATVSSASTFARHPRSLQQAQSQLDTRSAASPADGAAKAAAQQAKLHYVEIDPSLKGNYKFGYDTGSGPAGQSFREETRLDDGTVKGAYGYVDANGKQRIVKYTAGKAGFVVEGDQEAANQQGQQQAAPASPAPVEPQRRPQPVSLPQPAAAQPTFDEPQQQPQFSRAAPSVEDRARAEQQHAEQLRQHQLATQAALAQQQRLSQQLHLQQQQIIAAQRQPAQHQPAQQHQIAALQQQQQQQQHHHHHQQQQQQQAQAPQFNHLQPRHHAHIVDPQSGSFFSSSNEANLDQLLKSQLAQLQGARGGVPEQFLAHQRPALSVQAAPAFQQAAPQFAGAALQVPDFGQQRSARQAPQAAAPQFHHQAALSPQSALAALQQQQQQDAQMLAQLRAQQLARLQEQARQAPRAQSHQGQASQFQAQAFASQSQPLPVHQRAPAPESFSGQPQAVGASAASSAAAAAAAAPQPENFGPPVIDIRTLNYSIGQQTRV